MNSLSHWKVGTLLWQQFSGTMPLDRAAFLWGTVSPDFTPELITVPHKAALCLSRMESILKQLDTQPKSAMEWCTFSHQLGVLCHYMADYFCYAHNEKFTGSMRQHIRYEAVLHQTLKRGTWRRPGELPALREASLPEAIRAGHSAYLAGIPAQTLDIEYTFRYSCILLACILRAFRAPATFSFAVSYS